MNDPTTLDAGTVWTVTSAGLVLLMTPGLALFYGGMTRAKSALNMMMMSFVSMGLIGVVWVLWGYGMTHEPGWLGLVGNPLSDLGLSDAMAEGNLIPAAYAATFAVIAVALISGAVADRARFATWCVFVPVWVSLVYAPLAYMVWGGGLLSEEGAIGSRLGEALDFAGGLVVHISAGVAALVLALFMGKRKGFGVDPAHRPHNVPFVMLGAAILWFGWFGFNGGAAQGEHQLGLVWITTLAAGSAGMLGWIVVEWLRRGRPTSIGTASGIVSGLVAITPACAYVSPVGAIVIGLVSGAASALAVNLKYRLGFDDSLDVVGVHLTAGILGTVLIGFFALPSEGPAGLFYGGDASLLLTQAVAVVVAVVFTAVVTAVIALALRATLGLRVSAEDEERGVDVTLHSETAYDVGFGAVPVPADALAHAGERSAG
ncbi:ammonium transporter [Micrococcus sp. EYE_162]|uniref:ammonium transporter n=1 Tax=unclassified Micrococcus TaxID=2620948 RepID=UPI0020043AD5|nr:MULTISPECIES: ammonium transporter [unclassified Micrococcus]MCK6094357.1 ammonium transporter [Micrococcus sp. EYE_212]MCK6170538.1 ammonium transporter [Micrococcus sp. EYE_162]